MGIKAIRPLPSAEEIAERYPVTAEHCIEERRKEVFNILSGRDKRLLIVGGPCSAYPFDAVRVYADRYAALQEEVREKLLMILRVYIQKPRTTIGWPGPINQPDPLGEVDIPTGILECSSLMHDVGKKVPLADEVLFTHNKAPFERWLSYIALGARSTEDMEHRFVASGMEPAIGVKNPTSGDIRKGVDGVECVQFPHMFALGNEQVETTGNLYAHLVLRGGNGTSNYAPRSIAFADRLLVDRGVQNPAIVVDASHDNSLNGDGKDPTLQQQVVESVMWGITRQREEYQRVRGFMLEGFLKGGNQKAREGMDMDGLSITDPCLSWEDMRRLLLKTAEDHPM